MKKYKIHIISIMVILVMLLFALGTSSGVYGELTVINDTEKNLKFKVVRRDHSSDDGFIEEFALQAGQKNTLNQFYAMNTFANRGLGIQSFIIYNENDEIIKEYEEILFENILDRMKKGRHYYNFIITDELLE
jgi:hypothetical protein